MTDLTSTLKVVVDGSGARTGAAQVSSALSSMNTAGGAAVNNLTIKVKSFNDVLVKSQRNTYGFLKVLAGSAAIASFTSSLIKANREFAAFVAISKVSRGSIEGAMKSFENIKNISNTLGTSLEHNIKSFGKFEAAMKPIDKTGQLTQHMFEALSIASSGLHLTSLQLELSFKAIEQAASKNKPTLEEFQRQLAEHIPGAMAYLAEGVGLRMDEIHNAISKGTISIRDLLTGFANVLKQRFGDAAEYAAKQLPAALERMRNSVFLLNVEIGKSGAAEGISAIADAIAELVSKSGVSQALGSMFKELGNDLADFIRSITPSDIAKLQKALQTIVSALATFVKNIRLIFEIAVASIIGKYVGAVITSFIALRAKSIAAGAGLSILGKSMLLLRAALGGPAGLVALLITLVPLLAKLGRDSTGDAAQMVVINKQKELAFMDKSIKGINDQAVQVLKSKMPIDQKIATYNGLNKTLETLKASREKLASELSGTAGSENSFDDQLKALLGTMELPNDDPINPKGDKGTKKKDPLDSYFDDTTIVRMGKFNDLIKQLNAQFSNGDPTKLSREQYELWAQTYKKIEDEFITDVFGDGAFKTFDSEVADMIKDQQSSINELNAEMHEGALKLEATKNEYAQELKNLSATMFGDSFAEGIAEVSKWIQSEIKKINELQISPEIKTQLLDTVKQIGDIKLQMATLDGVQKAFSKSQSVISAKEQSLQAKVLTGLIDETEARVTLRKEIGAQGKALSSGLLPIIEKFKDTITDPAILASLEAIVQEIAKMVEIGSQTTAFKGLMDGLSAVANYTTDTYTTMKDTVTKAFESLEDVVVDFVTTGKASMKGFIDSIIRDLTKLFAKEYVSKPLAGSIMGLFSGSAGASGGGSGGDSGGISGLLGGVGNLFAPGAISAEIGMFVGGIGETLGMASAAAGSLGSAVATAIPYIGWGIAILGALGVFDSKPSNKAAGGVVDMSTGLSSDPWAMTGDKAPSQETLDARDAILAGIGGYSQIIKELGGTSAILNVGVDVGERDGVQFQIDGGPLTSYGMDPNAALAKLFDEIIVGTTGLEDHVKDLLLAFEGTGGEMLDFANIILLLNDYMSESPLEAVMTSIEESSMTLFQNWEKGVTTVTDLSNAFDGSLTSAQALGTAVQQQYQMEIQLIQQIKQLLDETHSMFGNSIEQIKLSVMDDPNKYDYWRTETDKAWKELETATDPARIRELSQRIDESTMNAWNVLTPEQQKEKSPEFVSYLTKADELTTDRLNAAQKLVTDSHDALATVIKDVMIEVAAEMKTAAQTPHVVDINVDVDVNTAADVEVGWGMGPPAVIGG